MVTQQDAAFDVIIVGGGTAGCVLASRLSECPDRRVLLIEAGKDHHTTGEPISISDPGVRGIFKPEHFWAGVTHEVIPSDNENAGLSLPFLQARVLGGGSAINGTHAQRGLPRDYREWRAFGVEGWEWDDVLPYFKKLETDLDFSDANHGTSGPIKVSRIPRSDWSPLSRTVHAALVETGLEPVDDMNGGAADGVGPVPLSSDGKRRMTASITYLNDQVRSRPNLTILADTSVRRLAIRGRRVVGVEFGDGDSARVVEAGETIVSSGAIHSPALLLRSGIGPKAELAAAGIPLVADRPGVGKNLSNHPMMSMNAHLRRRGRRRNSAGSPCSIVARYSSKLPDCPATDMILNLWERVPSPHVNDPLGRQLADFMFILNKPFSTGSVRLNPADPASAPVVRFNLLADRRDFDRMADAFRKGQALFRKPQVSAQIAATFMLKPTPILFKYLADTPAGRWISSLGSIALNGPVWLSRLFLKKSTTTLDADYDGQALEMLVRGNVNAGGHPSGTCRLGTESDDHAVVDSACRVIGVDGLRVIDASIFPTLMTAGTNLPVIMAAEKCAAEMTVGG